MKRLLHYVPLIAVFGLALGVRLVYNLVVAKGLVAKDDSALYNQLAYALAYNHCFCQYPGVASISRPPLWPLILSIFYHFTPQPPFQQVNASAAVIDASRSRKRASQNAACLVTDTRAASGAQKKL